ncbi:hypothetical protein BO83DRAFT_417746 [Aspergillus eucalypticola CBS 122712]|uniref:Biogenesis of lysosome-related organelles complex 1 subunit 1 n=1 Tax=Aspergillus eucalypticola (strain CBS 122712 / IBT 29274) TaxID=1448314 RepID=A0A317VDH4_ASPEC|nr:uncharacterized protein BO83DRAFT_417746 [Aspergillus eucalypticola CBS 122712]PWY72065.1 hypothetical protein BO83DRAFT_417746 [Aspergillus eucalypticola CBS 122712]
MPPTPEKSKETLEAKSAFSATLLNIGSTHASPLVERAHTITENAAALDKQQAELEAHTAALAKQNESWDKLAGEARDGLKEIGDVQNWAEMVERDLLVLEEMMGNGVGKGKGSANTSTIDGGSGDDDDNVVDDGGTTNGSSGSGSKTGSSSWFKWW